MENSFKGEFLTQEMLIDKKLLAQQAAMNSIQFNSLFGVTLYHVQTYK